MPTTPAGDVYARYLDVLNDRRFEDLDQVVHDRVTHNGRDLSRGEFADLLREDVATIPDLHYELRRLVVDGADLAARLWFSCTPRRPFRGVDTGGRRVGFAEHVFYELRDGRIAAIESVVDVEAVRQQASRPT